MRHSGVKGEYGEDNGHSTPEPHPGNVGFRTKVDIPEGKQREEHAQRTGDEGEGQADQNSGDDDLHQLPGVHQQPQRKEEEDLAQPRQTVKKTEGRPFVYEPGVPNDQPAKINGQKTIALYKPGDGINEDRRGKNQDGIEGVMPDVNPVNHINRQFSQQIPRQGTDGKLPGDLNQHQPDIGGLP